MKSPQHWERFSCSAQDQDGVGGDRRADMFLAAHADLLRERIDGRLGQ